MERTMDTPLLAADGETAVPSLSTGPEIVEESEFSRLIAQSSSLELPPQHLLDAAADDPAAYFHHDGSGSGLVHLMEPGGLSLLPLRRFTVRPRGPWFTSILGTLSLLHLGFVWSSYTADSWWKVHLKSYITWQQTFLPFLNDFSDAVIQSTNMASFFQQLGESRQYFLLLLLWFCSLLLPCAFMIVGPTMIVSDYRHPVNLVQRSKVWSARGVIELSMRWAWLTFYVIILLSMSTSFVDLRWSDTAIHLGTRFLGSTASYLVGISCAVAFCVVVRIPTRALVVEEEGPSQSQYLLATPDRRTRAPPPNAFQHTPLQALQEEDEPSMRALEETPEPTTRRLRTRSSQRTTAALAQDDGTTEVARLLETPLHQQRLGCAERFIVSQVGLLSVLMWIPSFYLPIVRIAYSGVAKDFLVESSLSVLLWEIPLALWHQGAKFGTASWILLLISSVLVLSLLVLPLLSTCLAVVAWVTESRWSANSRAWLYALHPALGGIVFCVALLTAVHDLKPLGITLLDEETLGICSKFRELAGESCLVLHGKLLPGGWCYLVQSLLLEVFVFTTLRWC